MAYPRGAVRWSIVCDCGISGSYSLSFLYIRRTKLICNNCISRHSPVLTFGRNCESRDRPAIASVTKNINSLAVNRD